MSALAQPSRISPFLWFDNNAAEAAAFYVSVFPNSRLLTELRASSDTPAVPAGGVLTVVFELDGLRFTALNGGPAHTFNHSISFVVTCADQQEIDFFWSRLTAEGGQEVACGWLTDKFGLSWQIVPARLPELLHNPAAMQAMMSMKKLDIAALERAAAPA
ncbi:MAG: VOC family protein [Acidobacteriota bacterium]